MSQPRLRIITGGQTGADQAAWAAARRAGLPTFGIMPHGFQTEDGPRPDFALLYNAIQTDSQNPAVRTVANARGSDGTLVFVTDEPGPGTLLTIKICHAAGLACRVLHVNHLGSAETPDSVAFWINDHQFRTLNVAGERESACPGLGARVETFLDAVFQRLLGTPEETDCHQAAPLL